MEVNSFIPDVQFCIQKYISHPFSDEFKKLHNFFVTRTRLRNEEDEDGEIDFTFKPTNVINILCILEKIAYIEKHQPTFFNDNEYRYIIYYYCDIHNCESNFDENDHKVIYCERCERLFCDYCIDDHTCDKKFKYWK